MRTLLTLLFASVCAFSQTDDARNQVTVSGGYAFPSGNTDFINAPGAGGTYAFRVWSHLWAEGGVFVGFQPSSTVLEFGYTPNSHLIFAPFGVRWIAPVSSRFEVSAGAGGLYERFSVSNPSPALGVTPFSAGGGYATGGAAFALDRRRHFWVGASPYFFFANGGSQGVRERWFVLTGDVGVRF
jgi:hypothetical protein